VLGVALHAHQPTHRLAALEIGTPRKVWFRSVRHPGEGMLTSVQGFLLGERAEEQRFGALESRTR
jgi:hypothetical protein